LQGSCIASLPGHAPIQTGPGELLLVPQGEQHILASSMAAFESLCPRQVLCEALRSATRALHRMESGSTRLICGYAGCGGYDALAALARLPHLLRVKGDEEFLAWLRASVRYCSMAWGAHRPGATLIAERIVQLVLLQALRQQFSEGDAPPEQPVPLAVKDRFLQRALALIHENPFRSWTVEELSGRVGLSRSALAGRFVQHLGEPPKQYLARGRIALAADALLSTQDAVVQIASKLGYDSEAAFSRAFKRVYGLPPARWRKEFRAGEQIATPPS